MSSSVIMYYEKDFVEPSRITRMEIFNLGGVFFCLTVLLL